MLALTKQERLVLVSVIGIFWCGCIIHAIAAGNKWMRRFVHLLESDELYPKVDLNKADERELERIPYIGPALAKRIIEYRRKQGRFKNVNEVKLVPGFRGSSWGVISNYLKVSPHR